MLKHETVDIWGLSGRSFGKAGGALIRAVNTFAQLSQHINALKTFENVALAAAFVAFSVATVSCHKS